MEYWFTSDTHFGHANFIRGTSKWKDTRMCRPFDTVEEHDDTLITAINDCVHRDDVLIHLGDFCFPSKAKTVNEYRERITCQNVWVLPGNHDKIYALKYATNMLMLPPGIYELPAASSESRPDIIMCHYAMRVWNKSHFGTWHLFGHSHGQLSIPDDSLSMDVGVDTNSRWGPYNMEMIAAHMKTKTFKPIKDTR